MTKRQIEKERNRKRQEQELEARLNFESIIDYSSLNRFIYCVRNAIKKRKQMNLSIYEVHKRITEGIHGVVSVDTLFDLEACAENESFKSLISDVDNPKIFKKILILCYQYFMACQYPPDGNIWEPCVTGKSL